MRKTTLLTALIVAISGLIGATPFLIEQTSIDSYEQSMNSSVVVIESANDEALGINADRNLDFGRLKPGTNATKFVNISVGKKSLLNMKARGNISEVLEYQEKIYLQEERKIELEANGREPGNYSGVVDMEFEIPDNRLGRYWLDLKYEFHNVSKTDK